MKKTIILISAISIIVTFATTAFTAYAEKMPEDGYVNQIIYGLKVGETPDGTHYILDNDENIIDGPFKTVTEFGHCTYAIRENGEQIMFNNDGSVIAAVPESDSMLPPSHGIYAIMRGVPFGGDYNNCTAFEIYDHETREKLCTLDTYFLYYLDQQSDKMVIEKDGKFAFINKYGVLQSDYVYDEVKQRFNPPYEPYAQSYAIVVQDGVTKYIDWDLNEINLDDYNGAPFITNSHCMLGDNGSESYKNFYIFESGSKYALYDLDTEKFIIPYQYDYQFLYMNDKYIIVKNNEDMRGVIDYSGNVVVPLKNQSLSFNTDGTISYYFYDGETAHEGVLNPEDGELKESELDAMGYFYKVIGQEQKQDIAYGSIVYENNKAADISDEDLKKFIDVFWNFNYERVIAPNNLNADNNYYIKLWNKEKTQDYVIYPNSGIIVGAFGAPAESHGETQKNYVWYLPVVGNGRNALYNAIQTLRYNYMDKTRGITDMDKINIPTNNMLSVDGSSDWAKPEIQKAAACNVLPYELTDKYTNNITRKEFCGLIYRLTATEFSPDSDSRMGQWSAINDIIYERQLTDKVNSVSFSDCEDDKIKFLSGAGIIYGMGDERFAPDEAITREQAATILYRTAEFLRNKTIIKPSYNQMYDDESAISDWAISSVASMKAMDIMKGVSEREFDPKGNYTVEQAIATVLRLYECY